VLSDVLETMRLTSFIFGRVELAAPWGLSFSRPDLARFYVVERGSALLEAAGAAPLYLSSGDVALLPRAGKHALRDAPSSPLVEVEDSMCQRHAATRDSRRFGGSGAVTSLMTGAFQFLSGNQTALLERLPPVIHMTGNDPASAPWLPATVQLLMAESASRSPGASVVVSRLADILLVHALRTQQHEGCTGLRGLRDPQIGRALQLIHGRPGEDWTVESLAAAAGISRSGFAARFLELVGEPPLQYLTRWRMKKAAQYLREQHDTIATVAEQVGYRSEASFNRAFKRWESTTPAAYRRANKPA
jgi:AraC-like DNA-binding protein